MKYQPPYGVSDEDAPYVNGDPTIAREGSIPPAASIEYPQREIVHAIEKNTLVPTDDDLYQLVRAMRAQFVNYAEDTGSANNLSVALDPPLTAYTRGLVLRVKLKNPIDAPSKIDAGAGQVSIKRANGADTGIDGTTDEFPVGSILELVYDGTYFQIINYLGSGGPGTTNTYLVKVPYAVDQGAPNAVVVTFNITPPITGPASLVAGDLLEVKVMHTNTGPSTIKVAGASSPAIQIKARGTGGLGDLLPGDLQTGDVLLFAYDGQYFQITPNPIIPVDAIINVPNAQFPGDLAATPFPLSPVTQVMTALARKRIASNATLMIQIADTNPATGMPAGKSPFAVNHPDATQIMILGTMKAGAQPPNSYGVWSFTGNTESLRATDINTNLAMLRARYGTEIEVVRSRDMSKFVPGVACGAANIGPGMPTIRDMLITGDIAPGLVGEGAGHPESIDTVGVYCGESGSLIATNVACSKLGTGFQGRSNAALYCPGTYASGCSYAGYFAFKQGVVDGSPGWSFSNGFCGWYGHAQSTIAMQGYAQYNQKFGLLVQTSQAGVLNASLKYNGQTDGYSNIGGQIGFEAPTEVTSVSPAFGTVGNQNSVCLKNW